MFLQELNHVSATGDVFGSRVSATCLSAQLEGSRQITRPLQHERVHGSASSSGRPVVSRLENRPDDPVICAAATDVAAHPITNLLRRSGVALVDTRKPRHNLARRAV